MAVITPPLIGILVLLSVIGVLVLGGTVVLAVETSRHVARTIRAGRWASIREPPGSASVSAPTVVGAAGPFSVDLRGQVRAAHDLLERADSAGAPVGELRGQLADLDHHATRIDAQLAAFDRTRAEEEHELLDRLRRRADTVSGALGSIRSYLAREEADRSDAELSDTVERVRIETEVLRSIRGEDALAEIEHPPHAPTGPDAR
ncbi:hypothetical protein [Nocardiopsis sp. NRRL B-16309]|uniref:hypothetical protein n=1 Tax=Nocardiopsis sp. NRRL B-16309 TaxID=1519494 RepID=UPI0006AFD457|nr:hypothetical protein [Nocardiopsis sp. NRRL B-16309]KOX17083.1 hypothetical protein ADL05_11040 [Nocardiopsis sp. NRRL B-16309]